MQTSDRPTLHAYCAAHACAWDALNVLAIAIPAWVPHSLDGFQESRNEIFRRLQCERHSPHFCLRLRSDHAIWPLIAAERFRRQLNSNVERLLFSNCCRPLLPEPVSLRGPLDHKPPQVPRLPPPVRRTRRGVAGPSACGFCGQAQCFIVDLAENTVQASVLLARSRQCRAHRLLL